MSLHLLHERSVIFVVRSPAIVARAVNSSWEIQRARSLAPRPSKSLGREEAQDDEHVILSLPVFGRSWLLENSNDSSWGLSGGAG